MDDAWKHVIAGVSTVAALVLFAGESRGECPASPSGTCRAADTTTLTIQNRSDDRRDTMTLKFAKGDATTFAELGDPTADTAYLLCTYSNGALIGDSTLPGGGSCAGKACWAAKSGTSYAYKDNAGTHGGITRLTLKASADAKTAVSAKGSGTNLPDLSLPVGEPLITQLHNTTTGLCFTAAFSGSDISANDALSGKFKARSGRDAAATGSPHDAIYNVISLSYAGDVVVVRTTDLPDHRSPFYPTTHALYEPYTGANPNFSTAINLMGRISDPDLAEQDITFRIPRQPTAAATHQPTGFGAIGIAINGVVLYNQYNGVGALLDTLEFNNMDQYNGHPTPAPALQYHYHLEPLWLTSSFGGSALVGFLLDGFPVYGPVENGKRLTAADLDDFHGHEHATTEYPGGIYHYHFTDDAPWLNGDAYYGTPGTVTR